MNPVFIGVLAYIAGQLMLGFWVARHIATEEDYLVAGRSLGLVVCTFTVFATWFGAETCVGAAGQAYAKGVAATTADPFGYALSLLLMGVLFAVALWRRGLTTLADLFRMRFGQTAERLAVLAMVPTSIMWAAAQIRAFGEILGHASALPVDVTVTIAAAVVIVYTVAGGLLADAITDLIQGGVLILGLVVVAVAALLAGDLSGLSDLPTERISLIAPGASILDVLEAWSVPILGSLVAQELVARVIAARSPRVARGACIAGAALYLVVGIIPVVLGLAAFQHGVESASAEQILVVQAAHYLPTALYVVFAGALVSAILSTVDSALLVAGSLVAHNAILPLMPDASQRARLRINRALVASAGILAYVLAMTNESVYELVEQASAFGTSGIFVCVAFGLYSPICRGPSANAAIVVGLVVYLLGESHLGLAHPYLASLAAACAVYLALARLGARVPTPADPSHDPVGV